MGERKYLMADVAKKLDIPPYMLRYYEDALAINIPRNERGLRYYRKQELELFASVLNLKQKGFDISAIRMVMDDIHRIEKLPPEKLLELRDKLDTVMDRKTSEEGVSVLGTFPAKPVQTGPEPVQNADDKMQQFKNIMTGIVLDALKMNNEDLGQQIKYTVTDSVVKEMSYIMKKQEDVEEERFKSIDQRLREVCAAAEKGKRQIGK
ncbi:MAG: MerR family transcriptional regulator [Lachnospiraceae bacterium]